MRFLGSYAAGGSKRSISHHPPTVSSFPTVLPKTETPKEALGQKFARHIPTLSTLSSIFGLIILYQR